MSEERESGFEPPKPPKRETPDVEPLKNITEGLGEQVSSEVFAAQHVVQAKGSKQQIKKQRGQKVRVVVFDGNT